MAVSPKFEGNRHLQSNVQVYNVRIPVLGDVFWVDPCTATWGNTVFQLLSNICYFPLLALMGIKWKKSSEEKIAAREALAAVRRCAVATSAHVPSMDWFLCWGEGIEPQGFHMAMVQSKWDPILG